MTRRRTFPGYESIADAIEAALDSSCIELTITHDGQPAELYSLARCLDKAGLIDWAAFPAEKRAAVHHTEDCSSDSCRPDHGDREDVTRSAFLAVLRRYETGQDTAADTLTVLQALGMVPTIPEVRRKPLSSRQRRQAARRAERQEGAA